MARLTAKERAQLPDRAFAYIRSDGKRSLPIHDAAHVRAALSRFNQVQFEDDAARDRARERVLRAAKKHGIMPIGFINAQLQPQRKLPRGRVTFLMTDLEGSTELLSNLGDGYAGALADVRRLHRNAIRAAGGHTVDARGDEFLGVFAEARPAIEAALAIQDGMRSHRWPDDKELCVRMGLHRGRPTLTANGYVGLSVHAVARICFAGHGAQTLVSAAVHEAVAEELPDGVRLKELGAWRFRGLSEPIDLFQLQAAGLRSRFPKLRAATRAY